MSTEINRIAELAKEDPKRQFHSIAHLITVAKLEEAFRSLRKGCQCRKRRRHVWTIRDERRGEDPTAPSTAQGRQVSGPTTPARLYPPKRTASRGRSQFPPSRIRSWQ